MHRPPRALLAVHAAFVLALCVLPASGCGGGGGGGGGGSGATTGAIEGTIMLPDADWGILAEREPNDSLAQAQLLPPLEPRSSVVVAGEGGTTAVRYGRVDTTDAFRAICHEAQVVTVALRSSTDGLATADFDIAVLDTATGSPVVASATAANPEVVAFTVVPDHAVDLVVTCASGAGAYTMEIDLADPPPAARVSRAAFVAPAAAAVGSDGTEFSFEAVDYALAEPDCVPCRVLVRGTAASDEEGSRFASALLGTAIRRTGRGSHVIEIPRGLLGAGGREALAAAAKAASLPGVVWAEPDWMVRPLSTPNDPGFARQWNLLAIGCPAAWDVTKGSPSVVVGVIDMGIAAHPDLDLQRVPGYDFVSDAGIAGDGDGRDADPTDPGAKDEPNNASSWHGTHVAGIIAARQDDGYGLSGVAPGCRIMPLRAAGIGGGTASDLADAIRYASGFTVSGPAAPLSKPLRIVNVSLGTTVDSSEIRDACVNAELAGTLVVAATGNTAGAVLFPAAYPSVLAVGAVDSRIVYASYSNVGPEVDLVAPGGNDNRDHDGDGYLDGVPSDVVDETVVPSRPGEAWYVGTSMAAPHVAGVAALVLSVDPTLTLPQLRQALTQTALDLGDPGRDDQTGAGLVRAGEAVRYALQNKGTPRTDPPKLLLSSTSLQFGAFATILDVLVANGGGGVLHVALVTASTDSGVPWLSAFPVAGLPGSFTDVGQVEVLVDRSGLSTGVYSGSIRVFDGSAAVGSIRVVMEVGLVVLGGIPFSVVAQEQGTGIVRASAIAYPWDGYRYLLAGLQPGSYKVHAGTDLNADGFFCQAPDWCGDHGGSPPVYVPVAAGAHVGGIDVTLKR